MGNHYGYMLIAGEYALAPEAGCEGQPVGFIQLVWVTLAGYLAFGDFPDGLTIIGALIVVLSGVYVFYREGVVKQTGS